MTLRVSDWQPATGPGRHSQFLVTMLFLCPLYLWLNTDKSTCGQICTMGCHYKNIKALWGIAQLTPRPPARNLETYVNYLRQQNVVNDVIYNVSGDKIGQKFLINRPLWKWLTKRAIFFSPSSLSQQGGYVLQKWKVASICQVISTGQHHNRHRQQVFSW